VEYQDTVTTRRLLSRKVVLSAAFLALAAGGTAACDASGDDEFDSSGTTTYDSDPGGYASDPDVSGVDTSDSSDSSDSDDDYVTEEDEEEEPTDEVFYCADEDGEIVDEDNCDDDSGTSSYFLWHSPGYPRGLRPGTVLEDGEAFPAGDRTTRRAFKLPATGTVSNGTIKTNIVGRSSGASSITGGTSGG
jgi:hypothetical protein